MKRHSTRTVCFAILLLSLAAVASAQDQPGCTDARLAGLWGYTETGSVVTPMGVVTAASVGTYTFDADGTVIGKQYSSAAGAVGYDTKSGTYTLNPDCTGTFQVNIYRAGVLTRTSVWDFVLVEKGAEMRAIMRSTALPNGLALGPMMTLNARRAFLGNGRECSAIAGETGYTKSGTLMLSTGPVSYAAVGKMHLDVYGNVTGTQVSTTGGSVAKNLLSGNLVVNADCTVTGTVDVYDESGQNWLRTAKMWIVLDDNEREARGIVTMLTVPNPAGGTLNVPAVVTLSGRTIAPGQSAIIRGERERSR